MSTFDAEPEDAWDRGDPVDDLVDNLVARARLLAPEETVPRGEHRPTLEALLRVVALVRRRRLTGRALIRANELEEDIDYLIVVRLED